MKGDAVLDYVEFQLTPPRTRCELFISSGGVREKLASGFLKPFIAHLEAVEYQISKGCESVRLDFPASLKDTNRRCWFTKGTLERFVRFVSTPEVLERVKSIEDELAQLQQVRSLQASSLPQVENVLDSHFLSIGEEPGDPSMRKNGSSQLTKYGYGNVDSDSEASKVELLKAMDIRLLALQQEQSMAFNRALAAGFNAGNMADLLFFSEYFGAQRLRKACFNFISISKKRNVESTDIHTRVTSSDSDMSLSSGSDTPKDEQMNYTEEQIHHPNEVNLSSLSNAFSRMTLKTKLTEKVDHNKGPENENNGSTVEASLNSEMCKRLSVSAAISVFENKQAGGSLDSVGKIIAEKQEINKVSMPGSSITCTVPTESTILNVVNGSRNQDSSISCSVEIKKPYRDSDVIQNALLSTRYMSSQHNATARVKEDLASVSRSQHSDKGGNQFEMLEEKSTAENSSAMQQSAGIKTINNGALQSRISNAGLIDPRNKQANQLRFLNSDFAMLLTDEPHNDLKQTLPKLPKNSEPANGNTGKLFGSLWNNSLGNDMQVLISLVHNHTILGKENAVQKGKFYEQYTMLRDAKLMKEKTKKSGERENRLRMLIEILRKKKEELDAQADKLSKSKRYEIRVEKYQTIIKSDLQTHQRDQVQDLLSEKFSRMSIHNSSTKQDVIPSSKPQLLKKGGSISQRGATPPRSKSPKTIPKLMASSANSRKTSITSVDNPLAKSVPCFGTFKKENTKPSPARQISSSCIPKNVNGRSMNASQAELHGDAAPEDRKVQPPVLRKNCTSVNDLKPLSSSTDDVIIAAKPQNVIGQSDQYKLKCSVVGSFQESKPFLRKGSSIALGLGAGMLKQKSLSVTDAVRIYNEGYVPESENQFDVSHIEDMDMQLDDDDDESVADCSAVQTDSRNDTNHYEDLGSLLECADKQEVSVNCKLSEEMGCIVKQPETEKKHVTLNGMISEEVQEKPKIQSCLSQDSLLEDQISPDINDNGNPDYDGSSTVADPNSQRACSPHNCSVPISISSVLSDEDSSTHSENKILSSLADLNLFPGSTASHSSSPVRGATMDSLLRSPSWKSPDVHNGSAIDVNKKLLASQKHLLGISSSKDSAKGFKRFLNFGKKSRASESVATDEASMSSMLAMSEIDDENEEQSNSAEEKLLLEFSGDPVNIQDQISASNLYAAPSVRSSIPNPPSNFRMREDHLTGSTMLKAPRSFFSLSSFRSKVAEARKVTS